MGYIIWTIAPVLYVVSNFPSRVSGLPLCCNDYPATVRSHGLWRYLDLPYVEGLPLLKQTLCWGDSSHPILTLVEVFPLLNFIQDIVLEKYIFLCCPVVSVLLLSTFSGQFVRLVLFLCKLALSLVWHLQIHVRLSITYPQPIY